MLTSGLCVPASIGAFNIVNKRDLAYISFLFLSRKLNIGVKWRCYKDELLLTYEASEHYLSSSQHYTD